RLGGDEEEADLARLVDVGAPAELLGEAGNLDDPDLVAVLVAEESEGALGEGPLAVHDAGPEGRALEDLGVHPVLEVAELARGDAGVVAEVEAEPVRG